MNRTALLCLSLLILSSGCETEITWNLRIKVTERKGVTREFPGGQVETIEQELVKEKEVVCTYSHVELTENELNLIKSVVTAGLLVGLPEGIAIKGTEVFINGTKQEGVKVEKVDDETVDRIMELVRDIKPEAADDDAYIISAEGLFPMEPDAVLPEEITYMTRVRFGLDEEALAQNPNLAFPEDDVISLGYAYKLPGDDDYRLARISTGPDSQVIDDSLALASLVTHPKTLLPLVVPHFVDGTFPQGTYRSQLVLTNTSPVAKVVEAFFYSSEGQPWVLDFPISQLDDPEATAANRNVAVPSLEILLAPHGSVALESPGQEPLQVGWAKIRTEPGVSASVILTRTDTAGRLVSRVGILAQPFGKVATVPVSYASGTVAPLGSVPVKTGFALANPLNEQLRLRYVLLDQQGNELATAEETLGRHQQKARFVDEILPLASFMTSLDFGSFFTGTVRIEADGEAASTALLQTGHDLSAIPVSLP